MTPRPCGVELATFTAHPLGDRQRGLQAAELQRFLVEYDAKEEEEVQSALRLLSALVAMGGEEFVELRRRAAWLSLKTRGATPCLPCLGSV